MKKIICSFFALSLLVTTSCKKEFFDINDNPNSPIEKDITNAFILPRALQSTASRIGTGFDYAAFWTGYWGRSGSYGQSIELESYALTNAFQSTQFTGWYDLLYDVDLMEKQGRTFKQPFYEAAAKTLKAIGFMYLVDQYNNVPYKQAFNVTSTLLPAYDKGEDIYADLLVQLDAAAKLFAATDPASIDTKVAGSDIMFAGDTKLWRKLINTWRLKLLIHESQVVTVAARTAVLAQITADGSGYLAAGEQASVNPGYAVADGQQNPFYNAYKVTALGITDQYNRANTYILNKYAGPDGLLGANNDLTAAGRAASITQGADDDVRYQYVFSKAAFPLKNPVYPATTAPTATILYNYSSVRFGELVPNSDIYRQQNQSDVAGPGLAKSPTQRQPIITSVESLFLQSEAIERGWIAGSGPTALTAAITESYNYLGATDANGFIARTLVDYNNSANKINFSVNQKYLSLIGLDNFEAYVDYRRLGVPSDVPLSLNASRGSNVVPLRLLYPQVEYNNNQANVAAQGTINAQTSTIFWDR